MIRFRGRSRRRFSIAALTCYKQGERARLTFRPRRHADHQRGGRRSFTWTDYRDLLIVAHRQLSGPIVLVWDNVNVHVDARLRVFIDVRDWITSYQLPYYAPDLKGGRGHLVTGTARRPVQYRLHRPRPPDTRLTPQSPRDPVPAATSSMDASPRPDSR
ncbi:hypothetical protein J2S55_007205 [Streptosporangium brasiliense]|uniref:Tc1-like transposase DDE domain-containing protein n=1 Tax=Streptosporangium brasiliense TaxID=47480 RepID=A0ABT9RF73_9ACTN|nr:hypothetical protein [Streptosporangium brasiliense]